MFQTYLTKTYNTRSQSTFYGIFSQSIHEYFYTEHSYFKYNNKKYLEYIMDSFKEYAEPNKFKELSEFYKPKEKYG